MKEVQNETYGTLSSSSASSNSVDTSSKSSFSFWNPTVSKSDVKPRQTRKISQTSFNFSSSSSTASRWCRRENLLIFSWSSRRTYALQSTWSFHGEMRKHTSTSSDEASSSFDSWIPVLVFFVFYHNMSLQLTIRRCILEVLVVCEVESWKFCYEVEDICKVVNYRFT